MKTMTIALVLFFSVSALHAQHLSFGPTVGFGHSWLSVEDATYNNEFHPAYNAGVKLVYSTNTNWGFSADVKFSGEGGKIEDELAGTSFEYRYRANYIRVPLQGIYFFGQHGNAVRPKISLGPSFGFLVGGEIATKTNGVETSVVKTDDVFDGFDVGATGAVGANFSLGGGKWLNTDISYYHGFTNVADASPRVRNRNLGINVGLLFPLGK